MNQNKSVSIIIPAFNSKKLLEKNLPILFKSIKSGYEVIVVDDASHDESVAFLKKEYPRIKVLSNSKNSGFSKTCNRGASIAQGDYLLFLNTDMEVTPNFIELLLPHFKDPSVFGVSPAILRPHENNLDEAITLVLFRGGCVGADNRISQKMPSPKKVMEIAYACGGAALYDKKKFLALGGFEELFTPFYGEDLDLCYNAWKRGWRTLYEPKSVVYHAHAQTIGTNFKNWHVTTIQSKNRYLFVWKNISDIKMLFSHLLGMLPLKILLPNFAEWTGLFRALTQLPEAMAKRRKAKKEALFSDKQIMGHFKHLIQYL